MAVSQNIKETGWFYHAPPRCQAGGEPAPAPPTSQIPGLSDLAPEPMAPEIMTIKEHDSPYVRMAKMGGRADLLRMHTPKEKPQEAKAYPKVDWFYTEDIKLENSEMVPEVPAEPHQFMLPDYMVHQNHQQRQEAKLKLKQQHATGRHAHIPPQKLPPYAMEKDMPFQNQGHIVKRGRNLNKNDERKVGFGIHRENGDITQESPAKYVQIAREQPVKPKSEFMAGQNFTTMVHTPQCRRRSIYRSPCLDKDNNNADMGKLMTHGYGEEWRSNRDKCVEHNKNASEIPADILNVSNNKSASSTKKVDSYVPSDSNARTRHNCHKEEEKKELFKMSKFKNIPSKLDCRRTAPANDVEDVDKELRQLGIDPDHE